MPARGRAAILRRSAPMARSTCSKPWSRMSHALQSQRKKVVIALWSEGSRDRMSSMLRDHKLVQRHQRQHLAHGAGDAAQRGHAGGGRHGVRLSRPTMSPSSASRTFSATAWCGRARPAASSTISSPKSRASRPAISSSMSSTASAASSACRRSMSPARRMIVSSCVTPPRPSCFCRSRTSSCCRATAPTTPMSSWIGSAAAAGRRARPS